MKRTAERGFTLIEIMIVVAIIALLAAIAIPNVLRGRTSANEAAAIGNIRALVSANEMYRSVNNVYAQSSLWGCAATPCDMYPDAPTPAFGPAPFGPPTANIGGAAPGPVVQGYTYNYIAQPAGCTDALQTCTGYNLDVRPQVANQTGTRAFWANQNATIFHVTGAGPASATCPTIDRPAGAAGC